MPSNGFVLVPLAPFRLDLTVWTLRRRADNAVDRWDGRTYRRILPVGPAPAEIAVTQMGPIDAPKLRVTVQGTALSAPAKSTVVAALDRLLGLSVDMEPFHRFAADDRMLGGLARRFRGMKPPRYATVFEGLINAIACQQLTLTVGVQLLNRLADACGAIVRGGEGTDRAFPSPRDLAGMSPSSLGELGFSRQKSRAILELARAVSDATLDLEEFADLPDQAALARLQALHGIGRWSAEYVLLRGLGRIDVFPGDDVGARNNLRKWLGAPTEFDYDGARRVLERWRPFGGLIYFHLLLDRLEEAGCLAATQAPTSGPKGVGPSRRKPQFKPTEASAMIHLKRAYETPASTDGERILVERLWPRGLTKAKAAVDLWLKDIAPSAALRKWFGHDPSRWKQFRQRYWKELEKNATAVVALRGRIKKGRVTLIYAAHDEEHNGALALKEFLEGGK